MLPASRKDDKANRSKAIELVAAFTKSPKEVLDSYFATGSDYYRDPNGCVPAICHPEADRCDGRKRKSDLATGRCVEVPGSDDICRARARPSST